MDAVLLVAYEYPEAEALRRALEGTLELIHTRSVARAQTMLSDPRVSILVLDCIGDAAAEFELLRWVERSRPEVECIALVDAGHFCAVHDTRRRNLYRLLKPAAPSEVRDIILRTAQKVERVTSGTWAKDPMLLRRQDRQFWEHLLSGTVPPSEEALLLAAPPTTFRYQERQQVLPVVFCLRRWHPEISPSVRNDHRFAVQTLAVRTLLRERSGCFLFWMPDVLVVLLYGPAFPPEDRLRSLCAQVTGSAARHCGCDVACYFGQPCLAHEVPGQADCLVKGDMDNVTNAQAVLSLAQVTRKKEPLSLPVLRDWMPYFIDGRAEEFCRCIEDYFQQAIAANNMDRAFLARFQQDFLQEIGFALKNAGVPLHDLFPGTDELSWMEKAIRYVPDMLDWVRSAASRAIALAKPNPEAQSISQRVCDYLNRRLVYPLQREELSQALHLSEGHIARAFRKEMGMSITAYLTEQRINLACLTIQQTALPLTRVAEQCGFRDYPYFYKTFKKRMGMSPTEYQTQMQNLDM